MRILYIVSGTAFGGAQQHTLQLAEFMRGKKHEIGIMVADEPRLIKEATTIGDAVFTNPHFVSSLLSPHNFQACVPVIRAIRNFQPDLVHCHSIRAGFAARISAVITRTPVVYTVHGWAHGERRTWWSPAVSRTLERLAARFTKKIICVSEYDREIARRDKIGRPEQYAVIRNGISSQNYDPSKPRNSVEPELNNNFHRPILISVARLSTPKNFDTLLEGIRLTKAAQLLIVGEGPLRPRIENLIRQMDLTDRVQLVGSRNDIPDLLATSDIFVLSSKIEGLPMSVIEAMMMGLPIVASKVGGLPELVEDGRTGFLVSENDPLELSKAISKLLDNQDLRTSMGQLGRKKAIAEFGLERMCSGVLKIYEDVLK